MEPRIHPDLDALRVPIASLVPDAANARTHSPQNLEAIKQSLARFGQRSPIVVQAEGRIIRAGNGRYEAAKALGWDEIAAVIVEESSVEATAFALADNRTAELAAWDDEALRQTLAALEADGVDVPGWTDDEVAEILGDIETPPEDPGPPPEPPPSTETVARTGDVWQVGRHQVKCGDATDPEHVAALFGDAQADLVHADPPYGMGKEKDGVANDNLYRDELDAFQLAWVTEALKVAAENASFYVWGNAPDLWRLWWRAGLADMDHLEMRNEIVWDKGSTQGVGIDSAHSYRTATERCLFFMRGQQFLGDQNADDYWEGYEPLRLYLEGEKKKAGWSDADVQSITGTTSGRHWFGKSQFRPIPRKDYEALREAAFGVAFPLTYDEVLARFDMGRGHREKIKQHLHEHRSFFDYTHDHMTDVWQFGRVHGDERHGHATPKPVELVERILKTSCPSGGLVYEPFLGAGTTVMAAERTGRDCRAMELEPRWVDVAIRRWQNATGGEATLAGVPWKEVAKQRDAEI